jgi:hypothetical protein
MTAVPGRTTSWIAGGLLLAATAGAAALGVRMSPGAPGVGAGLRAAAVAPATASPPIMPPPVAAPPVTTTTVPVTSTSGFTSVPLLGGSWFDQITVDGGSLQLDGTTASDSSQAPCVTAPVDPQTLVLGPTSQIDCDDPLSLGQPVGTMETFEPTSSRVNVAIAVADPQTGQVAVGPVVMSYENVSDTRPVTAFGGGWFWIYDVSTLNGAELLQVSETSGQVVDTIPMPKLYRPVLAANATGAWIGNSLYGGPCAGCGLPGTLYHVALGGNGATVVVPDPTLLVCWLLGDGDRLWVGMGRQFSGCAEQTIWRFDGDGPQPVFESATLPYNPSEVVGGEAGGLWTVVLAAPLGQGSQYPVPAAQDVVRIDPDTGSETVVATLTSFPVPLSDEELTDGQAVYFDGSLYVLEPPFWSNGYLGYHNLVKVTAPG